MANFLCLQDMIICFQNLNALVWVCGFGSLTDNNYFAGLTATRDASCHNARLSEFMYG